VELKDAVAVVTGGARGIGRGIALSLAQEGAKVVVADLGDRPEIAAEMKETARQVEQCGSQAMLVNVDVRDASQVADMASKTLERFGRIDILVNNAGVVGVAPVATMEEAEWDRVLDTNLKGTFLCCKAVVPHMTERRSGRIINMSSQTGKRGYGFTAHYCASKFAIIGFTQSLAHELGPSNITVNAICPGEVDTVMWQETLSPAIALASGSTPREAWEEWIRTRVPLGRPQTVEDIGQAVVFLCRAENITGESLNVTGGSEMA
jgi:meso-butanediol dehydrogenase/(S,S)-butanediol dehydrogenase/diacetyl reductase